MPKKSAVPDPNGVIQFRPGESFGRAISDLAVTWGVSRNEVVRRLALLAWAGLSIEYYQPLDRLAKAFTGASDFLRACDYVRGVLASHERDRQEQDAQPLQGRQRIEFVERCVEDFVRGREVKPTKMETETEPYRKIRTQV
jgi:hypothetical protein